MAELPGHPYYIQNRKKLLAENRKVAEAGRAFAAERYDKAFADTLVHQSLAEFEALIPELPYRGGRRNPLTGNLVSSAGALTSIASCSSTASRSRRPASFCTG